VPLKDTPLSLIQAPPLVNGIELSRTTQSFLHNLRDIEAIMAESEVATKAPESDAAEDQAPASIIPGDTPAQSGASLGVCRASKDSWHY
jgi:hypothetical protein